MIMSPVVEPPPLPPADAPRRRRWWFVAAAAVLVLVAGGVVATRIALRYAHAPGLQCGCGLAWAAPDSAHERYVETAAGNTSSVAVRPGTTQAFYVLVRNPASVTQTILGLAPDDGTGYLAVAQRSGTTELDLREPAAQHYRRGPVDVPPHGHRWLRFTIDNRVHFDPGSGEAWSALTLRVRVGAFTRTETVDFVGTTMELRGS